MKLTGCMLVASRLLPFGSSFTSHQVVGIGSCLGASTHRFPVRTAAPRRRAKTTSTLGASDAVRARQPLRLASQDQQDDGDALMEVSEFEQTSGPVKAFVGGLTNLFVSFSAGDEGAPDIAAQNKAGLSVDELEAGIRNEYAKNYLWTGDIDEALYEEDCSFTDPTLSFSGLSTYKRNVGSLQGVLDKVVRNSRSVLYSCTLEREDSCVQTRWRMVGDLRLPWGPTIDVVGRTTFSYDPARGNRIWSYDEVWEVEPAVALLQLFRPGRRKGDDDDALLSK